MLDKELPTGIATTTKQESIEAKAQPLGYQEQIKELIEDYYTSDGKDGNYRASAPLTELINKLYQKLLTIAGQSGAPIRRYDTALELAHLSKEVKENSETGENTKTTREIKLPPIQIGETVDGATPTVKPKIIISVDKSSGDVDVKIELKCHERHLANPILTEMKRIIES
jgi:hypothetical protein